MQSAAKGLILLLLGCSVIGLILSFILHLSSLAISLFGTTPDGVLKALRLTPADLSSTLLPLVFGLHGGLFLIWTPMILEIMSSRQQRTRSMDLKDSFKRSMVIFSGCPVWLKHFTKFLYFYFWPNFLICAGYLMTHGKQPGTWAGEWVFFSAAWMLGYAGGLAVLITVYRKGFSALRENFQNSSFGPWG
ncbi:MAG: hypothetical protein WBX25_01400 [Rhodomicrobium sp.]